MLLYGANGRANPNLAVGTRAEEIAEKEEVVTLAGQSIRRAAKALLFFLAVAVLYGCGMANTVEYDYPKQLPGTRDRPDHSRGEQVGVFGTTGISLFGGEDRKPGDTAGIGVNSFLWRASLDTISFMPLTSADPFGGVIITDWYTPPRTPDERFKVNAFILDRSLRADGVRVSVFRQVQQSPGVWIDAPVNDTMTTDLENAILTRARQIKIRTYASQ